MIFDVLTLFPDVIESVVNSSILGRAQEKSILTVNTINIRDFSTNKHRKVDDYPYGGGQGMVMSAEPIVNAYNSLESFYGYRPFCIYLTPQGQVFEQQMAKNLQKEYTHISLLCGHYEGVDERAIEEIVDLEVSIGDFVLTGGEIPAITLIDAISRLVPGVLGSEKSSFDDSFSDGLLEYPQYTRPYEYNGKKVPDVLLSGHHENIQKWRKKQSLLRTLKKRPDLFANYDLKKK